MPYETPSARVKRHQVGAGNRFLATATLDRLLHHSHVLKFKVRSYRLQDLEQTVTILP